MNDEYKDRGISFQFKRMDNIILRHLRARLAAAGFDEVTIMHGWIMGYLHSHSDVPIYQKDMEASFGIAKSTVTNILKLMEKKGYLTRVTDPSDTRCKRICLTEEGVCVHLETVKIIKALHKELETGITEEERQVFFRIIDKMQENIDSFDRGEEKQLD